MGEPYIGEIRLFAGNFPPNGWMFCDGQLLPISENDALFTLIGTIYGGDGQETFALPNLQSRVPIHMGTGPDGTPYQLGDTGGTEDVTLTVLQIPVHTHPLLASTDPATTPNPQGAVLAETVTTTPYYNDTPAVPMAATAISPAGGSQPHENCQPFIGIYYIISLFGVFPTQT